MPHEHKKRAEKSGVSLNSKARRSKISSRSAACVNFRKDFIRRPGQSTLRDFKVRHRFDTASPSSTFIFDSPSDFSRINFARMVKFACLGSQVGFSVIRKCNPTRRVKPHQHHFAMNSIFAYIVSYRPCASPNSQFPLAFVELHFARREIAADGLLNPRCK